MPRFYHARASHVKELKLVCPGYAHTPRIWLPDDKSNNLSDEGHRAIRFEGKAAMPGFVRVLLIVFFVEFDT